MSRQRMLRRAGMTAWGLVTVLLLLALYCQHVHAEGRAEWWAEWAGVLLARTWHLEGKCRLLEFEDGCFGMEPTGKMDGQFEVWTSPGEKERRWPDSARAGHVFIDTFNEYMRSCYAKVSEAEPNQPVEPTQ